MTGVDTNVLVRYFVRDEPEQFDRVMRFLGRATRANEPVWISGIVLCELAWVLDSLYGRSREEILAAIDGLMSAEPFRVESADAVRSAVETARKGKGGFADHLIAELNRASGCGVTVTFDRALARDPRFAPL